MPNFKTHILSGILGFPVFFLVFNFIYSHLFYEVYYVSGEIVASYFLFVVGSDFPDIDHQNSFINKLMRLFLIFGSVYYLFEYDFLYREYLPFSYNLSNFILIVVGVLLGLLLGIIFNKLSKHRGLWHSFLIGGILSVIIYLLNLKYRTPINILYSLSYFVGFSLHVILDKNLKTK
ncbi:MULTISPECIES: metal-dependent hydrolase [Petrotoga]|uniref:Metal-dependent hydrolase n=4 Tax=Petrotoga TaxID=28236 RepID=A0A2K1P5N2_9BACT|nr:MULTISPECIES: metal-dependent hydrolase [Petrotoga]PNR98104.1 hypothetical protein X929_00810 [Petrotoga olearia DSM 13574]POZ89105.1 hypothetical protein AA80_02200 [Petrotoga sibirica DSM 13575]RMA75519.1 LexA-binding, inner membrane-associated putative hydrolase [Petrotoga olearia]TDX14507.1 LexA-binding, inner membrane-associated putative hydrolase [Petrotoga sibirica]